MNHPKNFQDFIFSLCQYWVNYGCIWSQSYDSQMGAGTFHPHTFLKGLGPEPWKSVYVQPCRRPADGRYGKSPYRFQHYYQIQVLLKPSPSNIIDVFLQSLEHVGINLKENDIGLLEDDWKGPTLGAWGLGWEVRANGQEVTQFTYFQQLGGLDVDVVCGEITYGAERLFMYANDIKNGLDIPYNDTFTLGDIYYQNENEFSYFNFLEADVPQLLYQFEKCEEYVSALCEKNLVLPAYDYVLQASHCFNLLDARGAISVSERQRFIGRVRECAKKCAAKYKEGREKLGYPLLNKLNTDARLPILKVGPAVLPVGSPRDDKATSPLISPRDDKATSPLGSPRDDKATSPLISPRDDKATSPLGSPRDDKATSPLISPRDDKATSQITSTKPNNSLNNHIVFELGVEEMPPIFQKTTYKELNEKINSFLSSHKEKHIKNTKYYETLVGLHFKLNISSRRISVQFINTPLEEPGQKIELWGPVERISKNADGTLSQAALGFCKKNNIDPAFVLFKEKPDGSKFLYFEKETEGSLFATNLAQEFKQWIYSLQAPLKMKWLPQEISPPFIRPVRSILALENETIIPLDMFGLSSSNFIYGQRILSPEKIFISNANKYAETLKNSDIEIDKEIRKQTILNEALRLAINVGGNLIIDEELLDKCVGLFESPFVFCAQFNETYLKLPSILISSVLKTHMNYFSIQHNNNSKLLPYYIGVANYKCSRTENMIEGTKNVVTGRLDDGAFYYETDLATPISQLREKLKTQTFQENMGSLFDKSERLLKFAEKIPFSKSFKSTPQIILDLEVLQTAASFCKADLKSGCVQEFPDEMQGIMGGVLVRHQNLLSNKEQSELVAQTIEEHYLPIGANSSLPLNPYALALSFLDKLDSLCMMINFGQEPKGNKDPLGMRRLAFSLCRILGLKSEENTINLTLKSSVQMCLKNMENFSIVIKEKTENKIISFLLDRIKASLKEEFDIRAIESLSHQFLETPLPSVIAFIRVIDEHIKNPKYSLIESLNPYRRARNLTQNFSLTKEISTKLFEHETENVLYEIIETKKASLLKLIHSQKYSEVLNELELLSKPLDNFFNSVMVNHENTHIKENRLSLLFSVRKLYEDIADFSLLQV